MQQTIHFLPNQTTSYQMKTVTCQVKTLPIKANTRVRSDEFESFMWTRGHRNWCICTFNSSQTFFKCSHQHKAAIFFFIPKKTLKFLSEKNQLKSRSLSSLNTSLFSVANSGLIKTFPTYQLSDKDELRLSTLFKERRRYKTEYDSRKLQNKMVKTYQLTLSCYPKY